MSFIQVEQNSESISNILSSGSILQDKQLVWGKGKRTNSIVFSAKAGEFPVIVKTGNKSTNEDILKEYEIGRVLNRLRTIVPNFMYTYTKFTGSLDDTLAISEGENAFIVLEDINGGSVKDALYTNQFNNLTDILDIFVQLLIALEVAQREFKFTHYDMHCGNIMLKKLDKELEYTVYIDNKKYTIKTKHIPVIIDYGFSCVETIHEETRRLVDGKYILTESGKVLEGNGILSYMVQGADMYRFLSSCVMYTKNIKLKSEIISVFKIYGEEDPYRLTVENLVDSQREFVKKVATSQAGSMSPLQLLESVLDNYRVPCISVTPRKDYIYMFPIEKYERIKLLENVEECINHTPSYIISKYNVLLLHRYPINLEDEIYTLEKWINEHEREMKEYDNKILGSEIKLGKQEDVINTCIEITNITIPEVDEDTTAIIEKFNKVTQFFVEIESRLPFFYMLEELGLKPEVIRDFRRTDEYIMYNELATLVNAARRWTWTLSKALELK